MLIEFRDNSAPGDRSHIPEDLRPVFQVISGQLEQLKQVTPVSALFLYLVRETLTMSTLEATAKTARR